MTLNTQDPWPSLQADSWQAGLFCNLLLVLLHFVGCGLPRGQAPLFHWSILTFPAREKTAPGGVLWLRVETRELPPAF